MASRTNSQHDKSRRAEQVPAVSSVASDRARADSVEPELSVDDDADISARFANVNIVANQPAYQDEVVAKLQRALKNEKQGREREKQEREREKQEFLERIAQLSTAQSGERGSTPAESTSSTEPDDGRKHIIPSEETESQATQRVKLFATEGAYCAEDLVLNDVLLYNEKAIPLSTGGRVDVSIDHEAPPQVVSYCKRLDDACRGGTDALKQDLLEMVSGNTETAGNIEREPADIQSRTATAAQNCLQKIFESCRTENDLAVHRDRGSTSSIRMQHAGPLSPKKIVKRVRSASSRLGAKLRSRNTNTRNHTIRPRQLSREWVERELSRIAWDGLDFLLRKNLTKWPTEYNMERAWEFYFAPLGYAALYSVSDYFSKTEPSLESLKCRPDGVWKCLCPLKMMEHGRPIPNAKECKVHTRPDTMMELKLTNCEASICIFSSEGKNKDHGGSYKLRDVYKAAFVALASLVLMLFSAGESSGAREHLLVPFVTFSGTLVEIFVIAPYRKSFALYSVRKWRLGSAERVCEPKEIVEVWNAMWFTAYFAATQKHLAKNKVTDVRRTVLDKISRNWKDYPTKKTSRKYRESRNTAALAETEPSGNKNGDVDNDTGANLTKTARKNALKMSVADVVDKSSYITSSSDDTASALDFMLREIRTHGIGAHIVQFEKRLSPRETDFYSKTQGRYLSSWEIKSSSLDAASDKERQRCWVYRAQLKPRKSSSNGITGVVKLLVGASEKRVQNEQEILKYCSSKNICSHARVPVFIDALRLGVSSWALCMEWKGAALLSGPLQASKLLSWTSQILEALTILHYDLRIIHGDIKPGNVCEDDGGLLWFIDFELAMRLQDGQEYAPDCLGYTSGFAAPEVVERGLLTRKADVYSTGMTLKHWMSSLDEEQRWKSAEDIFVRRSLSKLVAEMTEPQFESRATSIEALKCWKSMIDSKNIS